jgi:hypothetical protein
MWFQQDLETAHITGNSIIALERAFGDRMVSRGLWPARLSDVPIATSIYGVI